MGIIDSDIDKGRELTDDDEKLVHELRESVNSRDVLAELVADNSVYVFKNAPISKLEQFERFVHGFPGVAVLEKKEERGNTYGLRDNTFSIFYGDSGRKRLSEMIVFAEADMGKAQFLSYYQGRWVNIDGKKGRLIAGDGRLLLVGRGSLDSFQLEGGGDFKGKKLEVQCYKAYKVPVESLAEISERKLTVHPGMLEPWRVYSADSAIGRETESSWRARMMCYDTVEKIIPRKSA